MFRAPILFLIFQIFGICSTNEIKTYGCRCLEKELTHQPLANLNILEQENDHSGSSFYTKIAVLRKWLSTLTLHNTAPVTTTTTTTTTTLNPLAEPFDEASGSSSFIWFAAKEMHIFDKFECVCDGDLIALTRAKTFINIKVTHD